MVDVQQVTALAIVGMAAVALARHGWNGIKSAQEGHCPGCGECGREEKPNATARPAPKATPLITLSAAPRRRVKAGIVPNANAVGVTEPGIAHPGGDIEALPERATCK